MENNKLYVFVWWNEEDEYFEYAFSHKVWRDYKDKLNLFSLIEPDNYLDSIVSSSSPQYSGEFCISDDQFRELEIFPKRRLPKHAICTNLSEKNVYELPVDFAGDIEVSSGLFGYGEEFTF